LVQKKVHGGTKFIDMDPFVSLLLDMTANNYQVGDAGETIIFSGIVKRSLSQALFLVFVTGISMATLALVLNIQFVDLGAYQTISE
jgi:hypothetical protein